MRAAFLLFGFIGFSLVLATGIYAGRAVDVVLRDAAIGCLASALIGRWWMGLAAKSARQLIDEKQAARAAKPPAPPPPAPAPAGGPGALPRRPAVSAPRAASAPAAHR